MDNYTTAKVDAYRAQTAASVQERAYAESDHVYLRPADMGGAVGQRIGGSDLQGIAERIHKVSHGMAGIAGQLRDHADRVHGGYPECGDESAKALSRSGQLGAIYDALDILDRRLSELAEQAGRNSNIA